MEIAANDDAEWGHMHLSLWSLFGGITYRNCSDVVKSEKDNDSD